VIAGLGEREGVPFRFVSYALYAFPMMVVSIAICHVYVWWRYF
jgi:Na+/H+ antiporter NhaD/arsenite permease-like protein